MKVVYKINWINCEKEQQLKQPRWVYLLNYINESLFIKLKKQCCDQEITVLQLKNPSLSESLLTYIDGSLKTRKELKKKKWSQEISN